MQGQSLTVAITGADTHFDQALSVASFGGAITVNSLTITSPTTATAAITIAPAATIGVVPVVVSTRGESAVLISAFTILPGTPVLDELSPANGQQGQALDVLVTGRFTTFLQDSTTASFGAGITVNLVTVSSPTSAVVNVTIDALTPAGSRDVTLTTGTQVVTRLSAFGVVPGIAILTAVTPSSGQQGRSVVVAITGSDTHFDQTTTADFGPGITVDSLTVTNATQASASITIDALAQIGLRTVTLQTAGEAAHRVNGFNVLAGTPLVTSLTPITGRQGETLNVTILGQYTNFQQNVSVADFGAGITVHSLTVNAPTSATANISIDPITPLAGRTITVTTGTEVATGGSFQVQAGTAILTQVSPASARQGETVTVDIVGQNTHFAAGATTASVSGSGVAAGAVTVTSATTASLALTLEPFAPAGPRTVTLTTSGEAASIAEGFSVIAGTPRLTALTPTSATQGQTLNVIVTGQFTTFQQGVTSANFGTDVVVNTVTVSTPTSATVNITVSALAATGGRTVTLTTDSQSAQSTAGAFVVQAGNASIASVVPATGQQAQTLDVAITGFNTHFASGQTTIDFGAGVSVNSLTVASLTTATANVTVTAGATLGAHTVTATTSGEVAQLAGGFTVTAGQPTLVSLSPNQGHQAEQVNVAVTTQFTSMQQGLTTASFGAGITVQSVTVTSATSATISVIVAPTAALGARTVSVSTGTEIVSALNAFNVLPGLPMMSSVDPNVGTQGQSLTVVLNGLFTSFSQGVTTVSFGSGIAVGTVTVNGPTLASVPITIGPAASTGPRSVTVTTGSEIVTLSNGFTVMAGAPVITVISPNVGSPNSNLTVQITGQFTNFQQGVTVASFGPGISVGGGAQGQPGPVTVSGTTTLSASVFIASGATLGPRNVTVQTGAESLSVVNGFTVSTTDTTPPSVFRVSPASGATGVPLNTDAYVEFNEPIDRTSVIAGESGSFGLRDQSTGILVPATLTVDASGRIVRLVPLQLLAVNHGYYIALSYSARIRDAAGNQMFNQNPSSFTTGLTTATTGPTLVVTSPDSGAAAVPTNTRVRFRFNKPINPLTQPAGLVVQQGGAAVPGTYTFTLGDQVLTFVPAAPLAPSTAYTVSFNTQLTDTAGNSLTNPGGFGFTTGVASDGAIPTMVAITPAASATNVGTNAIVRLVFDERIDPISVTDTSLRLTNSATSLTIDTEPTISEDRLSVTLTPVQPLQAQTSYTVWIAGVGDLAGNTVSFLTSSFTTGVGGDATGPGVVEVSPAAGLSNVPVNARVVVRVSEPVTAASVSGAPLTVTAGGGGAVAGTAVLSSDRQTVTWTPAGSLAVSTTYAVSVSGWQDDSGNAMTPFGSSFTTRAVATADTTGPTVSTVSPTNGATGVGVTTPVVVTFSEAVDPTSVATGLTVTVQSPSAQVAGSATVNGAVATFTPATPWPGSTLLQVTITGVRDLAGNSNGFVTSTFTTAAVADTTPPTVLSVVPADGTTAIGPNATVVLTFSESLNPATVSSSTVGLFANGQWLGGSVSRTADNRTVLVAATLPAASVVTVVATRDVTDLSGNALADFRSSFTTAAASDTGQPTIVRQRPSTGTAGVVATTSVVLYASEPLLAASVPGAVFVAADGVLVSGTTTVSGGGQVITFVPAAAFAAGALVEVFVEPTATDLSGNPVTRYQGSFRVAVDPALEPPTLVETSPAIGSSDVPRNVRVELGFSEALDPASVATATVTLLENGGTPVPVTLTLVRGGRVLRLTPGGLLAASTFYSYSVTGVRDLQGTTVSSVNGYLYTGTASDAAAPTVVAVSPPAGTSGVGVNADIRVRFSEGVNPLSVTAQTVTISDGSGQVMASTITFADGDREVVILPHRALGSSQTVQVAISGVEDLVGNGVVPQTTSFTTAAGPDLVAPAVVEVSPFSGATDVPVNAVIQVELSEALDPATVTPSALTLQDNVTGQIVVGTVALVGGRVMTFVPASALAVGRGHTLYLATGSGAVRDLAGNAYPTFNAYGFTTTTAPDTIAPVVTGVSPAANQTGVPINTLVMVRFNEPIAAWSADQIVLRIGGQAVAASVTVSDGNRLVTLRPAVPLLGTTAYTVTVNGVVDLSGNVVTPQTTSFTTAAGADLRVPAVSSTVPTTSATNVGTNAVVEVRFNERINPFTVTATTLRVTNSNTSTAVRGTLAVTSDHLSATFTPLTPLQAFTSYMIQISGITDLAGWSVQFTTVAFTTGVGGDATGPGVVEVSPAAGLSNVPVNARVVVRVSEPVTAASVSGAPLTVTAGGGGAVAGTAVLSSDRQTVTWTPAGSLAVSTTYAVSVSGWQDDSGNAMTPFGSSFTTRAVATADTTGPTVSTVSPTNGATGVGVTTPVVVTFSEAVDPTSVATGLTVTVQSPSAQVAGSATVNGAVATFTPATPWPGSTLLQVTITGVRDLAGNSNGFVTSTFTTAAVADTTPPTVLSVVPADGTTAIGPNATVVLTFSESLNPATVSSSTVGLFANGQWLGGSVSRTADNRTVLVAATLPAASVVTVVATRDVTDLSGNALADFRSSFTTAAASDTGQPTIVRQRPSTGTAGVVATTSVVLYASEPLLAASVPGAVFVAADGVLVSGTTTVSGGGQVITFVPAAAFAAGALVEVFVEPTATDLSGNPVTRYQGSFRVAVDPALEPPTLVETSPAIGSSDVPRNVRVELGFSEALDPASVATATVTLLENGGTPVPVTLTLVRGGRVLRLTPGGLLAASTFYSYSVTGVRDLQGTTVSSVNGYLYTGTASDAAAPTVVAVSPPAGTSGVGVNADIRVRFSEGVNPLSVTAQTVTISDGSGQVMASTITFADGDREVVILPHRALGSSQTVQVAISGVEDLVGNGVVPQTTSFTTAAGPDLGAPVVVEVSPFSGATDVPVNVVVQMELNEPLDPSTVTASALIIQDNSTGQPVAGTVTLTGDRMVTFVPSAALGVGRSYTFRLATGSGAVRDLAGNAFATFNGYAFSTTTAPDTIAPVVTGVSPAASQTGVPINAMVVVRFNEPIAAWSADQIVVRTGGQAVAAGLTVSDGNRQVTLRPVVPLLGSTAYTVTVDGIVDLSGNVVAAQTTNFTTAAGADLRAPTVASTVPTANATNVGTNAVVQVQFSERVNPLTVTAATFRLLRSGSVPVEASLAVSADGLSATLTPATLLQTFTSYVIQVNGVADLPGWGISNSLTTFTTGAGPQ